MEFCIFFNDVFDLLFIRGGVFLLYEFMLKKSAIWLIFTPVAKRIGSRFKIALFNLTD